MCARRSNGPALAAGSRQFWRRLLEYTDTAADARGYVPLRDWMAASQDLTAKVHTIIRTTIGQYYVHKISARGFERAYLHPGAVTFIQRFGRALNLKVFVSDYTSSSE